MSNPFVHIELTTTDVDKAKNFYQSLFAWELEDMPAEEIGTYTLIKVGEGTGGGMMKQPHPDAPPMWVPYIMVDDVAASTEKARSLGATILKEKTEVKDMGWFSVIMDPTGATFGIWQAMS